MKNIFLLLGFIVTILISGCGGDGGNTPSATKTFSGVAAVGYPIVGGTVTVRCATGSVLTSTSTSTGTWQVTLSDQTLPCAVQVSGGTINNAANTTPYHSIAMAIGTVNITPLTDMMVANLAGAAPDTWFTGLSATPASLAAISQTHVDGSLANLRAALNGLAPLSTINPITTAFSATPGNTSDDMLAALQTSMTNSGTSYGTLLNAASASTASFTSAATTLNSTISAASSLVGTWNRHRLQAGRTFTDIVSGAITSVTSNWNHGIETVDALGNNVPGAELTSNGSTAIGTPSVWSISADGVIADSALPTFHGTLSTSHDLIVATRTAGNGVDPRLVILQKQNPAITFTAADFAGTWNRHRLQVGRTFTDITTGAITGTTNNWSYGVETWDASGNYTEISGAISGGGAYTLGSGAMSISADGTITDLADPSLHGTMSASKDLVVVTRNAGNGIDPRIVIFQKQNPAITFTAADLAGTWNRHRLQAGRTFTDIATGTITSTTSNWNYGIETWDANGNAIPEAELSSDGNTNIGAPYTLSISADGTITDPSDPNFHGTMSASKDLVVVTRNAGNGIDPRLVIFQRK